MPPQAATIKSLPMAFEFVKAMRADGVEWGEEYQTPIKTRQMRSVALLR